MKTSRYFEEQVLRKRPYLRLEWCELVVSKPIKKEIQSDGRIRYWGLIPEVNRIIRVVLLEDGVTLHSAFFDRSFRQEAQ